MIHLFNKFPMKVCGNNGNSQLKEESNNISSYKSPCISPPCDFHIEIPSLLSYSICNECSVYVTRNGSLLAIGCNYDGNISNLLPSTVNNLTNFSIKDSNGRNLSPISAACFYGGTVYLVSNNYTPQLYISANTINNGKLTLLNIGNFHPVYLYSGHFAAAAIGINGDILNIYYSSLIASPNEPLSTSKLPDGEKAVSIVCDTSYFYALSSNGRLFCGFPSDNIHPIEFKEIEELIDEKVTCLQLLRKAVSLFNELILMVSLV